MTQKPPRYSLDSANGPSVTIGLVAGVVDGGRLLDRRQAAGEHPRALVLQLLVEPVDGLEDRLHLLHGRELRSP